MLRLEMLLNGKGFEKKATSILILLRMRPLHSIKIGRTKPLDNKCLFLQEMLMNLGSRRWMIVSICIELAMDHKPSHRELTSVLISELYLKVISQRDIGKGTIQKGSNTYLSFQMSITMFMTLSIILFSAFDHLLHQLPDLILDTPDAPEILGNFLARSIADDCIPPKFLHR